MYLKCMIEHRSMSGTLMNGLRTKFIKVTSANFLEGMYMMYVITVFQFQSCITTERIYEA